MKEYLGHFREKKGKGFSWFDASQIMKEGGDIDILVNKEHCNLTALHLLVWNRDTGVKGDRYQRKELKRKADSPVG